MTEDHDQREETERRGPSADPVGTVLGLTFGPFGAAVGSVVDSDRFAVTFAFGTGGGGSSGSGRRDGDGGLADDAVTVEFEEPAAEDGDATDDGESNPA